MKTRLTKEEKEMVESLEKGVWIPVKDLSKRKKELMQYARNTMRKDKRINIRISERDLIECSERQSEKGCRIRLLFPASFTSSFMEH